jgi:serine/threonine protein kinase
MAALHGARVFHDNLDPSNILLDNNAEPKVGALSHAQIAPYGLPNEGQGFLPFMAPELLTEEDDRVTRAVDVYAFGLSLCEILSGERIWKRVGGLALLSLVLGGKRPNIAPVVPEPLRKLIGAC